MDGGRGMEKAGNWGQSGDAGIAGRQRVEAVVQTLAAMGARGESLAEVAHDARNMVTALGLYCDLLEEPNVLAVPFAHYASELRLVAGASRRLVEKLVALETQSRGDGQGVSQSVGQNGMGYTLVLPSRAGDRGPLAGAGWATAASEDSAREISGESAAADLSRESGTANSAAAIAGSERRVPFRPSDRGRQWETMLCSPLNNFAAELQANRNLLAALAGPGIAVTVDAEGGARPVRLTGEDLTRLLVNLVKNAAEAIPSAAGLRPDPGQIQISLREREPNSGAPERLLLAIEDNGPGIPPEALGRVFESGFTTHARNVTSASGWPIAHRGLGLAITRSIVEASGGHVTASNREPGGARIEIELPVRTP